MPALLVHRLLCRTFGVRRVREAAGASRRLVPTVRYSARDRRCLSYAAPTGSLHRVARVVFVEVNVGRVGGCRVDRVGALSVPPGRKTSKLVSLSSTDATRGQF